MTARFFTRPHRDLLPLIVAAVLLLGVGSVLVGLALRPGGSFGYDFAAYYDAASRVWAGNSPYDERLLRGVIDAKGAGNFLYPPFFAQIMSPLSLIPERLAAGLWLIIQTALLLVGIGMGAWAAGARRPATLISGSIIIAFTSLPTLDNLIEGNVAGVVAFAVGLSLAAWGSARAGVFVALAGLIKLTPLALAGPQLHSRWTWIGLGLGGLLLAGASVAAAPDAWRDWTFIVRGQIEGNVVYPGNLAPAAAAALVGLSDLAAVLRVLGPLVGVALIGAGVLFARMRATALTLALVGSWLVPPVFWSHYLVALSVVIAYVWPRAQVRERIGLAGCLAALSLAPLATPFAWVGIIGVVALVIAIDRRVTMAV